jgi:hypothetical protein
VSEETSTLDLEGRAERLKMERLLELPRDALVELEALDPDDVRRVRERISDLVFAQGAGVFDNLLAASKLLPDRFAATIAQRVFPPMVTAQIAGSLEPDRAADLIVHVDIDYLAELSGHVDPRAISHIIPALPDPVMVDVARRINQQGDHLTAGRLVGHAPDRVIPQFLAAIPDERDLLEIAFFLEAKERLDDIVRHVPDDRIAALLAVAAREELWPEALRLTTHLSDAELARLAGIAAEAPAETVASLVRAAQREGLWPSLLPLVARIQDADLPNVARVDELRQPEVLAAVVRAGGQTGQWDTIVRVVAAMDGDARREVAEHLPDLDELHREQLVAEAKALGLWDRLGPVADRLEPT